jgi:hypothetical protein
MHQRVFGDIEAKCFEPRTGLDKVLDEKTLAGTNIEHAIAGLEAEMLDYVLGDRQPSPIVTVSPVAGIPRPVEIFASILPRDTDIFFALRARSFLDITLGPRVAAQQVDFSQRAASELRMGASNNRSD